MRNPASTAELSGLVAAEQLRITTLALDIDDDASVTYAFEQVLKEHGRIDVLVNNAGIGGPGTADKTPRDTFRRIMETNYFGALRCINSVLPGMIARRSGCIINTVSVVERIAHNNFLAI
jgi:NAD(P)-dependent dehydrogenase (short-subunit alcohol dehydrogenase family)